MSYTPRTSHELKDLVKQVMKYNENKNYKILKADPKENQERSQTEREISKKAHESMRKAQMDLISGGKKKNKKQPRKTSTKKKPVARSKRSNKK